MSMESGLIYKSPNFPLEQFPFFTAAGMQRWAFISLLEYRSLPLQRGKVNGQNPTGRRERC